MSKFRWGNGITGSRYVCGWREHEGLRFKIGVGEAFANRENAGDGRGADGAEADEQDAELSACGDNLNRCRHKQKLYIIPPCS